MKKLLPILLIAAISGCSTPETPSPRVDVVNLGAVTVKIHETYSEEILNYPEYTWAVVKWEADGNVQGEDNVYVQFDAKNKLLPDIVNLGWKDHVKFSVVKSGQR